MRFMITPLHGCYICAVAPTRALLANIVSVCGGLAFYSGSCFHDTVYTYIGTHLSACRSLHGASVSCQGGCKSVAAGWKALPSNAAWTRSPCSALRRR